MYARCTRFLKNLQNRVLGGRFKDTFMVRRRAQKTGTFISMHNKKSVKKRHIAQVFPKTYSSFWLCRTN